MMGASYKLSGEDGSPNSKNDHLQLETEKKHRRFIDIDLKFLVLKLKLSSHNWTSIQVKTVRSFKICLLGLCKLFLLISLNHYDFDLCGIFFEESGHDAADYIRMDLPPSCSPKGSQKDPEVVINPNVDQKSEVCENKSLGTVTMESGDIYFDA
ncbi:hypothetical protein L1887_38472 [Cichorium endivia]|nr:hypothetical protein L1887_38472 [Cichorium endivia]